MARAGKKPFDVAAFIRGVERPTSTIQLCMDATVRERTDTLMAALGALKTDDEPLMGDPRRDEILAELRAISENTELWTSFTLQAPSHASKAAYMVAMAEQGDTAQDRILAAEAAMLADCVVRIADQPVTLDEGDAMAMLEGWPDALTQELVEAINDLGATMVTAPLSRRLSETLAT